MFAQTFSVSDICVYLLRKILKSTLASFEDVVLWAEHLDKQSTLKHTEMRMHQRR